MLDTIITLGLAQLNSRFEPIIYIYIYHQYNSRFDILKTLDLTYYISRLTGTPLDCTPFWLSVWHNHNSMFDNIITLCLTTLYIYVWQHNLTRYVWPIFPIEITLWQVCYVKLLLCYLIVYSLKCKLYVCTVYNLHCTRQGKLCLRLPQ